MTRYLSIEWILAYHGRLLARQGQQSLLMGEGGRVKLEAALARPQTTVFGDDAFPTLSAKAAALLQAVAIAHPFTDGNKRAAAGAILAFLEMNGILLDAEQDALYDLVIAVTTGELREVEDIASSLRELFPGLE